LRELFQQPLPPHLRHVGGVDVPQHLPAVTTLFRQHFVMPAVHRFVAGLSGEPAAIAVYAHARWWWRGVGHASGLQHL
jgi:hypothetical protein